MSNALLEISFAPFSADHHATTVILAAHDLALGSAASGLNTKSGGAVLKAAEAADFKGKSKTSIELLAVPKIDASRLIVAGIGKSADHSEVEWAGLGGVVLGLITARKVKSASLVVDVTDAGDTKPEQVAAHLRESSTALTRQVARFQPLRTAEIQSRCRLA